MSTGKTYSTKYLLDTNNNRGAEGQVLISTSEGVNWSDGSDITGGPYLPLSAGSGEILTGDLAMNNNIGIITKDSSGAFRDILKLNSSNVLEIGSSSLATDTIFKNSGNVGIGTTSPGAKLEVVGTSYLRGDTYTDRLLPYTGQQLTLLSGGANTLFVNGNVGIGTTSPGEKLEVNGKAFINGQIYGGFGAKTTSGTLDWDDSTNARSGNGHTLLRGNATNGPAGSEYYHPFSWEYSSYDNDGNMTQFAIPYSSNNTGMYYRNRYNGTWNDWAEIVTTTKTLPGGPYLPLSAGASYPLTDTLFGTGGYFTSNLTTNGVFTIQNAAPYIQWNDAAGTRLGYIQHNTNLVMNADSGQIVLNTAANNDILINPGGTGKVGIGTTSPGYPLEVDGGTGSGVKIKAGNTANDDSFLVSNNNDVSKFLVQGDGKVIINSSAGVPTRTENFQVFGKQIITNTGTDGPVLYLGYNSSGSNTIQLGRGRTADGLSYMDFNGEVMSAGEFGFRIIRYSGQNASTELKQVGTGAFKVICSDSANIILNPNSGSVGISQTNPSYKLDVTGDGRFTSTVTAANFILSSDERLKENVEKVCDNKVKADWKTFELKTEKGQKRYGVIAQELEKTNPEFVREDSQGFKSVAYIDLLIAKIAELEARLEKLEK